MISAGKVKTGRENKDDEEKKYKMSSTLCERTIKIYKKAVRK